MLTLTKLITGFSDSQSHETSRCASERAIDTLFAVQETRQSTVHYSTAADASRVIVLFTVSIELNIIINSVLLLLLFQHMLYLLSLCHMSAARPRSRSVKL